MLKFFLLNACRNLISNLAPDRDAFEIENDNMFSIESVIRMNILDFFSFVLQLLGPVLLGQYLEYLSLMCQFVYILKMFIYICSSFIDIYNN